jgi:hypothetical protein
LLIIMFAINVVDCWLISGAKFNDINY